MTNLLTFLLLPIDPDAGIDHSKLSSLSFYLVLVDRLLWVEIRFDAILSGKGKFRVLNDRCS